MTIDLTAPSHAPLAGVSCSARALAAWLCALVLAPVVALIEALDQLVRSFVRERTVVLWW